VDEDDNTMPPIPTSEIPVTWADFWDWLGIYHSHGEHGVIYYAQGRPQFLIKVVNCDITDDDGMNDKITDFFMETADMGLSGLPKIVSIVRCEAQVGINNQLKVMSEKGGSWLDVGQVLDLDVGDELGMWMMEKVPYIGLTHPRLTRQEMIRRVAKAATEITVRTQYILKDLRPPNYGFRKDGSAVIFDPHVFDSPLDFTTIYDDRNYQSAKTGRYMFYWKLIKNNQYAIRRIIQ